jgi:hypothetical protein
MTCGSSPVIKLTKLQIKKLVMYLVVIVVYLLQVVIAAGQQKSLNSITTPAQEWRKSHSKGVAQMQGRIGLTT